MKRVTFYIKHEDYDTIEKYNNEQNEENDTELKISARFRQILRLYIKENMN